MKIIESTVKMLTISDITGFPDPIRVTIDDLEPGRGRITIVCFDATFSAFWGAMGPREKPSTVAEFFCRCDEGYLASNLCPGMSEWIYDPEGTADAAKREVLRRRKARDLSSFEARGLFDRIGGEVETTDRVLYRVFGDEYWSHHVDKRNPTHINLCRIVVIVQEALRSIESGAVTAEKRENKHEHH